MTPQQEKLEKLVRHRQMGPYIDYIRFPFYKNLTANTRIDFSYPITALVGPNGTNKSSVLRAIMGCPANSNLGNFWFSTKVDPIVDDENNRPAFIHGYFNKGAGKVVEVLKVRISKQGDPNYWEPSRPIRRYGMETMPPLLKGRSVEGRTQTRWNPVEKDVIYLDFRSTLSAFDKFFYHGDMGRRLLQQSDRKELIVARSPHLKAVVDGSLKKYDFHKVQRVHENIDLPSPIVERVGHILGKNYESIRLVKHSFFNTLGYSAILATHNRKYSEAFAGSGEFAVVMAVFTIMSHAKDCSLILMDEPEVSLHPGAQQRLVQFLTDQVEARHHQIVISTHSPTIVRELPRSAVKVFSEMPNGEVFVPTQEATLSEAFFGLGEPLAGKKYLVVEDRLAAEIVKKVLRGAGVAYMHGFEVVSYPGGASSLWKRFIPVFAAEQRTDVTVLFDADQRPAGGIVDPSTIPESENVQLANKIKLFAGCEVDFAIDGGALGGNLEQLHRMQRKFIDWARNHVRFMPGEGAPEQFLLRLALGEEFPDPSSAKQECVRLTRTSLGLLASENPSSEDIFHWQRTKLAHIADDVPELIPIKMLLDEVVA